MYSGSYNLFIMIWQLIMITFTLTSVVTAKTHNNACRTVSAYHFWNVSPKCTYNPDVKSDIISIINRHGYQVKKQSVTTNDGYILNLFRISSPDVSVSKYPIFILHGIAIDAESWVAQGNKSLAFNLVERGYDVWVGTIRGTINANKHKKLNIDDPDYWNFNLDTLAREDMSTQLKFVVQNTNQKVLIIGHSMGTTMSFMFTSKYVKDAAQLVKGVVALAPIVYLTDLSLFTLTKPFALVLNKFAKIFNIKGLFYQERFIHQLLILLSRFLPEIFYFLLSTLPGISWQVPPEDLLLFFSYWPSGLSIFLVKQYYQIAYSKRFQMYDYGVKENQNIYGSTIPLVYNLSNIEVPCLLFYGKNDIFYRKENLERLSNEIGNNLIYQTKIPVNQVPKLNFNHMDFLYSKNIFDFFYEDLFAQIKFYFG